MESQDTILPDESLSSARRKGQVDEQSRASLAEVLFQDFRMIPKKAKTDLDEYAIINVGPSVVPNPYVPTFRVYAYNATGKTVEEMKKGKKNGPKRKHGHRHPGRETEVDCKKKANRDTWACRPEKPHYTSKKSPSRQNTRWTPLGYAQARAFLFHSFPCSLKKSRGKRNTDQKVSTVLASGLGKCWQEHEDEIQARIHDTDQVRCAAAVSGEGFAEVITR